MLLPLILWSCLCEAAPTPTRTAVLASGETFETTLAGIDGQGQVLFLCKSGLRQVPATEVVLWGHCPDVGRGPLVLLDAASWLAAEITSAHGETLSADSALFGPLSIPRARVAGAVFLVPSNPLRRDQLLGRVASGAAPADRLILINDDEIAGRIESIHDEKLVIDTELGRLELGLARVRAMLCSRPPASPALPESVRAMIGFADGTRLAVTQATTDQTAIKLTLPGNLTWAASLPEVVWLQPLGGRVVYVSDLQPAEYRHVPFLDLAWPYRTDRNVLGGQLRVLGRLYAKGLGVHSAARLTYQLAEPYQQFQAELAIDDSAQGRGSVRFRVFVDGQAKYTSPVIRGGEAPLPMAIQIAGAKRLDLVVDFAEWADQLDHADWLNARLVK